MINNWNKNTTDVLWCKHLQGKCICCVLLVFTLVHSLAANMQEGGYVTYPVTGNHRAIQMSGFTFWDASSHPSITGP